MVSSICSLADHAIALDSAAAHGLGSCSLRRIGRCQSPYRPLPAELSWCAGPLSSKWQRRAFMWGPGSCTHLTASLLIVLALLSPSVSGATRFFHLHQYSGWNSVFCKPTSHAQLGQHTGSVCWAGVEAGEGYQYEGKVDFVKTPAKPGLPKLRLHQPHAQATAEAGQELHTVLIHRDGSKFTKRQGPP